MGAAHFRVHQRFHVDIEVVVSAATRPLQARGRLLDLGIGGAACELDLPLRMGEEVRLVLASTADGRILRARVAWVAWAEHSSVRAGVRFDEADSEELAQLLRFLGVQAEVGSQ